MNVKKCPPMRSLDYKELMRTEWPSDLTKPNSSDILFGVEEL